MVLEHLMFVTGSKIFEMPRYWSVKDVSKKNGIQSERFTLGGYDWVIEFYPQGIDESVQPGIATVSVRVLDTAEGVRGIICSFYIWNWITSEWVKFITSNLTNFPSGDRNLQRLNNNTSNSKFLDLGLPYRKDNMLRMKCDILVTPRSPAPAPALKPDGDKPAGNGNQVNGPSNKYTKLPESLMFVTASKIIEITHYWTVKGLGKKNGIQSERFTLGSYDWVIEFYPICIIESAPPDTPSVSVRVLDASEEVQAMFYLSQWNWTTSEWDEFCCYDLITLQPSGDKARWDYFCFESKYLEDPKYLKDDTLRIKFDLLVTPRPPGLAPSLKPNVDKPSGIGNQGNPSGVDISFDSGFHTATYAPPNTPTNAYTKLPRQPTVRLYCQANDELSVTARNGTVVLAPADSNDHYQHWIKDMSYGDKVKDEDGLPAFALVNRVTAEALKNPAGENEEVTLVPYNPNHLENSVKWTEVASTGFRSIRIADTTSLNLTAVCSNFYFSDGAKIVVQKSTVNINTAVQRWKIVPC